MKTSYNIMDKTQRETSLCYASVLGLAITAMEKTKPRWSVITFTNGHDSISEDTIFYRKTRAFMLATLKIKKLCPYELVISLAWEGLPLVQKVEKPPNTLENAICWRHTGFFVFCPLQGELTLFVLLISFLNFLSEKLHLHVRHGCGDEHTCVCVWCSGP